MRLERTLGSLECRLLTSRRRSLPWEQQRRRGRIRLLYFPRSSTREQPPQRKNRAANMQVTGRSGGAGPGTPGLGSIPGPAREGTIPRREAGLFIIYLSILHIYLSIHTFSYLPTHHAFICYPSIHPSASLPTGSGFCCAALCTGERSTHSDPGKPFQTEGLRLKARGWEQGGDMKSFVKH